MFGFGLPEMLIVFTIVMVVFGAGKLPEIASSMGKSITNFKKALKDKEGNEIDDNTGNNRK